MLAAIFETSIIDLKWSFVPIDQYKFVHLSKEEKFNLVLYNHIENTLFIYDANETFYFWNKLIAYATL